ncbi:MAG: transglycosylase SLT domain-containing protein [Chloroflexi bacterium]|uniref:Transglycosylase SLT domain-containing protein n=1 Tax=Candidatus Chlorohelix allophototropha TaxID=3003348 RepID=A0A8T7M2F9_9CHLR|nr:transglycosylase SLT domain-containing protein [Chloroflexota bacterium]WJW65988.1 transglycosylase SLT domain-containing protein [Chloroflexota bacterium L227-S17]
MLKSGKPSPQRLKIWLLISGGIIFIIAGSIWVGFQLGQQGGQKTITTNTTSSTNTSSNPSTDDFSLNTSPKATQSQDDSARLAAIADVPYYNGQYSEAVSRYRFVLQSYPNGTGAGSARYGLAQAEFRLGKYKEAIDDYLKFQLEFPSDPRRYLAYFGIGEAQANLGQWEQAIASYQQYLAEGKENAKVIEGYVNYAIAEAYIKGGKQVEALDSYKKAADLKESSSNLLQAQALEKNGDYYAAQGKAEEAVAFYKRILDFAKVQSYRADVAFKIATAYDKAKMVEQANAAYRVVIDQYFGTSAAGNALQILIDRDDSGMDDYFKGYNAYRKGDSTNTLVILDKFLKRPAPTQPVPAISAEVLAAEQLRFARAWYWEAVSYERLNNSDRAISEYKQLAARFPTNEAGEDAQWQLATLLRQQNKADEAITEFAKLSGSPRYGVEAQFNSFSLILQKDGADGALESATKLFNSNSSSGREALFRVAEAYSAQAPDKARPLYQKLAAAKFDDYYSIRAAEILAGVNPLAPVKATPETHPAVFNPQKFAADFERERKELETWLSGWATKTTPNMATPSSPSLEAALKAVREDSGIKRMIELTRLSKTEQANREAMEAQARFSGKPLELYCLALLFNDNRQYSQSILAAKEVFALYQKQSLATGLRSTPTLLQKLIYPLDFQDIILEFSKQYDFDPLLLAGLIKQESAFDPTATSGAEARGLSQVIPATGRSIATTLGISDFSPEDLYQPYTAIRFGAYFLNRQLDNFNGNPYAALAGYNGGPGNVGDWLKANPPEKDFDLFVDGITYGETRQYVRIVYTNYAVYRELYKSK